MRRFDLKSLICLTAAFMAPACLHAEQDDAAATAPKYVPHKVAVPKSAPYLLPDGSIYIAGNDLAAAALEKFNALFVKTHPGFKFKMDATSSGQSIAGMISGKSAFGATARDVTIVDQAAFRSLYGYPWTDLLIGWDNRPDVDHFPPNGKFPAAVWVNARNPVPGISLDQLKSILLTGTPGGDITKWGQIQFDEGPVGQNNGDYAKREIHIYLPVLKSLPVVSTDRMRLGGGLPWAARAEYVPQVEDVMNAVANDPFGIGFLGWFPVDEGWDRSTDLMKQVRLMPLQKNEEAPFSHGTLGDVYPLTGGLHLLLNFAPGKPREPWIEEYARMVLSKDGQDILQGLNPTDGFLPLQPDEIGPENAKLADANPGGAK